MMLVLYTMIGLLLITWVCGIKEYFNPDVVYKFNRAINMLLVAWFVAGLMYLMYTAIGKVIG